MNSKATRFSRIYQFRRFLRCLAPPLEKLLDRLVAVFALCFFVAVFCGLAYMAVIGIGKAWPHVVNASTPSQAIREDVLIRRFLPVSAPPKDMIGVPWTGFFALDSRTGQLCVTRNIRDKDPEWVTDLPECVELYSFSEKELADDTKEKTRKQQKARMNEIIKVLSKEEAHINGAKSSQKK